MKILSLMISVKKLAVLSVFVLIINTGYSQERRTIPQQNDKVPVRVNQEKARVTTATLQQGNKMKKIQSTSTGKTLQKKSVRQGSRPAALNPQPLLPVDDLHKRNATNKSIQSKQGLNRLNPQPLPPVADPSKKKTMKQAVRPKSDINKLNPQPLPPVDAPTKKKAMKKAVQPKSDINKLNPQPLPPKQKVLIKKSIKH